MDTATKEGSCPLGGSIGDPVEENQESREDMLSRHRREITELQNKELALKKAAAKGSKAEQKAKKKQVEDEVLRLSSKLKEKHSEELTSLGYTTNTTNGENSKIDNLVKAIAGVSVSAHPNPSKPSKGAKRRDKRAQQEAAREQRIQEEQSSIVSDRMIENERLERKLEPLGLVVNEIKPDGHCLYRAIEDQLSLDPGPAPRFGYLELRKMAADYMRRNLADFLPFFLSEGKVEVESGDSAVERFKQYCEEVVSTAVWGGQLELGALTHCLEKHIVVYSGSFPDVEMGRQYKSEGWSGSSSSSSRSVMLSYHVHAYGLGEHYNSVVPRLNK